MIRTPDTGAVRTVRILAGLSVVIGLIAFGLGKYADGPEPLCSWIAVVFCGVGVVLIAAYLVMRPRQRRL